MKILSVEQIREVDRYTIDHQKILSHDLMERAAASCCSWLEEHLAKDQSISIFCGPGNNGGDGLAMARILIKSGYKVKVFTIGVFPDHSIDFGKNLKLLQETDANALAIINSESDFPHVPSGSIIIDALFGTGLSRPVEGLMSGLINYLNDTDTNIISVDIPSGLFADSLPENNVSIIRASHTLSFQLPKFSFLFPSTNQYVGEWHLLNIGLDKKFIDSLSTDKYYTTLGDCRNILMPRNKFSHKGNFGHALLVSGSKGKMGAAVIAASACLRSGVGLLTVHTPSCGTDILQVTVPEAIVSEDAGVFDIMTVPNLSAYGAVAIGPGCGTGEEFKVVLEAIVKKAHCPLVLDADAINSLAQNPDLLNVLYVNTILTPHIKEFDRICGISVSDFERHEKQKEFSNKYKVFVVLKGAHTCISTPDGNVYFNSTGNPGMAKGGSGDALTGVLLALLAQGYSAFDAARLGVYVHGLAGDIAKEIFTEYSMTAMDITTCLGRAFKKMLPSDH